MKGLPDERLRPTEKAKRPFTAKIRFSCCGPSAARVSPMPWHPLSLMTWDFTANPAIWTAWRKRSSTSQRTEAQQAAAAFEQPLGVAQPPDERRLVIGNPSLPAGAGGLAAGAVVDAVGRVGQGRSQPEPAGSDRSNPRQSPWSNAIGSANGFAGRRRSARIGRGQAYLSTDAVNRPERCIYTGHPSGRSSNASSRPQRAGLLKRLAQYSWRHANALV